MTVSKTMLIYFLGNNFSNLVLSMKTRIKIESCICSNMLDPGISGSNCSEYDARLDIFENSNSEKSTF